jgi:MYXO-CTERM domain-containing protein
MADRANWPNDYNGAWNYASYLPAPSPGTQVIDADKRLGASGMSIDRAWTYTVGRDDVLIAVLDSGIEWEQPDLVNKAALNLAELAGDKRPKGADGKACGGAGALAGYDCNGDGVFSIADYVQDARFSPRVPGDACFTDGARSTKGPDRLLGDLNKNCILDPGDLIEMFSDGVDDDGNGYVDDIAGWDFFKNDNNPYDDTRYGHGTVAARDSSAEANNGTGEPGVCPKCRFIPLRVGDSFFADANDFAKAAIYATDMRASVIQEALSTLNQTPFSKAAIDYAYKKNVLVVASMADANSRHHNLPATANHTMTVHNVRYDGQSPAESSSFVAYGSCSNYGAHLALSVSSVSCSREATARYAGIAGLMYSMAKDRGLELTSEEAMQLGKMYADDIDVAASRLSPEDDARRLYFSRPGFDQRFGYGRANAERIVRAIDEGKLPPEVDIVSPEWFTPIFGDRAAAAVPIMGRIAARRAKSYDFQVEWAPGAQPEDADFRPLTAGLSNVPGSTVTGGADVPLATFDPKQLDSTHPRDPDSSRGENDRSVTFRVRATAHYGSFDVAGEARRTIALSNTKNNLLDADLLPGFPLSVGSSAEASPKLADLDGDGIRDIVYLTSDGAVHALSATSAGPKELPGFPYLTRPIDGFDTSTVEALVPSYRSASAYKDPAGVNPSIARETLVSAPAIADMDGDGKDDIVFVSYPGTLYVIDAKGRDFPGWPRRLPLVPSCPLAQATQPGQTCMDATHVWARGAYASPVVVDMDNDGRKEIVLGTFDGLIRVFRADGKEAEGFPVQVHAQAANKRNRIMTTPTVADFNGDGIPDIAVGSNEQLADGQGAGPVFVVDGRGTKAAPATYLPNWPVALNSLKLFPLVAEGVPASQVAVDLDGDGVPELIAQGNGARPLALRADPGTQSGLAEPPNRLPVTTNAEGAPQLGFDALNIFGERTQAKADTMLPMFSQPSVGDLDQDGVPDVVMSGGSPSVAASLAGDGQAKRLQHMIAMWSGKTGRMMPGSPVLIEDHSFSMNHAIADISGDDYPEVISGNGVYFVHAVDACGRSAAGWPKFTGGWVAATAAVGDIDGDPGQHLDVVTGTRNGYLFAWRTAGRAGGAVAWESFHHDNANTGDYARPLSQGRKRVARSVIDCKTPEPVVPAQYDVGGGCVCTVHPSSPSDGTPAKGAPALAAMGLLAALVARRRRRPVDLT